MPLGSDRFGTPLFVTVIDCWVVVPSPAGPNVNGDGATENEGEAVAAVVNDEAVAQSPQLPALLTVQTRQ